MMIAGFFFYFCFRFMEIMESLNLSCSYITYKIRAKFVYMGISYVKLIILLLIFYF